MLIAIEGIDGSGKGTQASLLGNRLRDSGVPVELFRFPRYAETFFGREVGKYLNGEFGTLDQVPAKLTSLLYALDRFETFDSIESALREGRTVICDRYVGSNMAHQAARTPIALRPDLMAWVRTVEYDILKLRRPDVVFFLDMPVGTAQNLVGRKDARSYTTKSFDLHEASASHLRDALENFRMLAKMEGWVRIPCTEENGRIRAPADINDDIFNTLTRLHGR